MRPLSYIIYNTLYKPVLKLYLKTDPSVTFDGFKLKIPQGVFHPKLFFSTPYFYEFIGRQDLKGSSFLEIGSGSGLLSLLAARKGAKVTAIDISPRAINATQLNLSKNFKEPEATILESDLFSKLVPQTFDVIIINPPYFFKSVTAENEHAWYCGAHGEYFEKLFSGLAAYSHAGTRTFMILADNCDIDRIQAIAAKHAISFELADSKKIKWETNFIFRLHCK